MLTTEDKVHTLKRTTIFSAVPDTVLVQLADTLEEVRVKAGEMIFKKGDSGSSMYVVAEGQVRAHDGELFFNHLNKGDVFGEMAALDPDVRSASITAEIDTVLFRLDQESLYNLMSTQIEMVRAIIHVLSQHLRNRVQDLAEDFHQRKALEHELEIGREIQTSFLPDTLPQVPGWEIAAYFEAAREVSGDFYDAFTIPHTQQIALVIGDVCDKGVGAALFMTLFRSLIRATSSSNNFMSWTNSSADDLNNSNEQQQNSPDSKVILKNSVMLTNNYIARTHGDTSMFATLFFALLDPTTGVLTYINGGHLESPIILNQNGITQRLEPTGPAVGLFPDVEFEISEAHLDPGDTLLTFTDGVTEAKNQDRAFFSEDRLLALLEETDLSAAGLLAHIRTNLVAYIGDTDQSDDITMLAVKRRATPS